MIRKKILLSVIVPFALTMSQVYADVCPAPSALQFDGKYFRTADGWNSIQGNPDWKNFEVKGFSHADGITDGYGNYTLSYCTYQLYNESTKTSNVVQMQRAQVTYFIHPNRSNAWIVSNNKEEVTCFSFELSDCPFNMIPK